MCVRYNRGEHHITVEDKPQQSDNALGLVIVNNENEEWFFKRKKPLRELNAVGRDTVYKPAVNVRTIEVLLHHRIFVNTLKQWFLNCGTCTTSGSWALFGDMQEFANFF